MWCTFAKRQSNSTLICATELKYCVHPIIRDISNLSNLAMWYEINRYNRNKWVWYEYMLWINIIFNLIYKLIIDSINYISNFISTSHNT